MPTIARLIGGAGTGKTTELLRLLEMNLERGIDPLQVGFVSFTRAARRNASERAAALCGGSSSQLETDGWFRTLHSICFKALECSRGQVVTDDKAGSKWLEENIGESAGVAIDADDMDEADFSAATDVGRALQLWHAARNRLEPLRASWEYADAVSDLTPPYETCADIVTRYEQAKRLDDKQDFSDILGDFAGWHFDVDGHEACQPRGYSPNLPVWFFDEQQDTSALLDSVCKRLIKTSEWVYVVGDFFQSIYGWAGADARLFMSWDVAKSRTMPKSYRCPKPVHDLGESILRDASDYWDRGIACADHDGVVDFERYGASVFSEIDPTETWLLLARTNYHAARLASRVKELGIPWKPTRGEGGWSRPSKNKMLNALYDAAGGSPIESSEWGEIIKHLPSKCEQGELLKRGTKTSWKNEEHKNEARRSRDFVDWGATPLLTEIIESKQWPALLDNASEYVAARDRYGYDVVNDPRVMVGTIHSVKGFEADNVLWLTTGTRATAKACEEQRGFDDECKVAYVAATRARRRLIVAVEPNQRHRFKVSV